jgi:hypothetical protein
MVSSTKRSWYRRALAATLAAAFAATTMGASSCGTSTTDAPDSGGGGDAKAKSPKAKVGDSITLKGQETKMKVTVVKIIDPVSAGQFDQPSSGRRYVGVKVKLRNVGQKTYSDSPSNGATLITSGDEQADSTLLTEGDCSAGFSSDVTISSGSQEQGCIAFEVKKGKKVKRFQFGLDSGFGPQTGEWSVK